MQSIEHQTFDAERALYGSRDLTVRHCNFDGPADGESAFKECANIGAEDCFFNLRYPFWHDHGLTIRNCELTELCRAALWYSDHITIEDTRLHGIKALRECAGATLRGCDIVSPEFGWSVRGVTMEDCTADSEYFMMRSTGLRFAGVRMKGKYSFQYIEDAVFDHCTFDTKDAFWHAKNVMVKNSVVKGEYLAWYCENVTFENCRIDRHPAPVLLQRASSSSAARWSTPTWPLSAARWRPPSPRRWSASRTLWRGSTITVPAVGEVIRDIPGADGRVILSAPGCKGCA